MVAENRPCGRRLRTALLGVVLLTAAACSTSSSDKAAGNSSKSSNTKTPTTAAGTKATGTPIKIGFVNTNSGPSAIPAIRTGTELAVKRINDFDNGINGHPIDLDSCSTDGTPESSAACANKLVADKVAVVIEGEDVGTDAKIPILRDAGIALIGNTTAGTSQSFNQDAFFFSPAATTYPTSEVDLAAHEGVKKLALVAPDLPLVPIVLEVARKQGRRDGVDVQLVKFDPAAPDFDAVIAAAKSNGSDGIAMIAIDEWCNGLIHSAQSAGYTGKIDLGECLEFSSVIGAKQTAGMYTITTAWKPSARADAPADARKIIDQYEAAMIKAGKRDQINRLAWIGYIGAVQSASALRTVKGDYTAANVMDTMRNLENVANPVGEPITCKPRPQPGTSGCAAGWLWFVQRPDGTAKLVSNGFVAPKS